ECSYREARQHPWEILHGVLAPRQVPPYGCLDLHERLVGLTSNYVLPTLKDIGREPRQGWVHANPRLLPYSRQVGLLQFPQQIGLRADRQTQVGKAEDFGQRYGF